MAASVSQGRDVSDTCKDPPTPGWRLRYFPPKGETDRSHYFAIRASF